MGDGVSGTGGLQVRLCHRKAHKEHGVNEKGGVCSMGGRDRFNEWERGDERDGRDGFNMGWSGGGGEMKAS